MPIAFKKPPINEVVVATYFTPPLSTLRSEHIGLFWQTIRDEFPIARQQPPVALPNEIVALTPEVANDEFLPMPRYWFIADNEINLIQVQKNAFMFNWRRRDQGYPRFHRNIKPMFDKYYGRFNEFLRKDLNTEDPTVDLCELSYINALERCDFWDGPDATATVIPSFSILAPDIDTAGTAAFNCNYVYKMSTDLQLNIGIRTGVATQQQNKPVLVFEIKASGRVGEIAKPATDEWFERAHDAILKCFLSITSGDVRTRFWEAVEETQ